jgi:rubrerythrin
MIASDGFSQLLLHALAPLVWRNATKISAKLYGFAATEAGSALDMLKAAELADEPRLRRLFFRHAMDEARHAALFRDAARTLGPTAGDSEYRLIHARRQNLFARMSLTEFIAFVYLAERRGELQFQVLRRHFDDQPELEGLFARVAKDERFHVVYSAQLLDGMRRDGRRGEVRTALLKVRARRAWEAWRRAGRVLGDVMSRVFLSAVYLLTLPLFAAVARAVEPPSSGWKKRDTAPASLEAARRQF